MTDLLSQAIAVVFHWDIVLLIFGTLALGIMAGAMPGLSSTMSVAVISPLTFSMEPFTGIMALLGIYVGSAYGGSISAILLGIPGTPGAIATVFDGYPMARKGKAGEAIGVSTISSFVGGILSVLALALLSYPIASFALAFGPREYLALAVFALTAIASLSTSSVLKGVFSAMVGLFVGTIGLDAIHGMPRFNFGSTELMGGISFIPLIIGLFAVPETLVNIEKIGVVRRKTLLIKKVLPTRKTLLSIVPAQLRSAVVGIVIGTIPGTGTDIAAIVSYAQGRNISKRRESFGTGIAEGVACPEAANNAAVGGTMIPLLTLGVPGGAVTAIIMGAFMTHGLKPGPLLMTQNADLVYQIFVGLFVANIGLLILGLLGARLFAQVLRIHEAVLSAVVLLLCIVGSFAMRSDPFDVVTMFSAGLLGYLMVRVGVPRAPLIIGLILGPMVEVELSRTLLTIRGDWTQIFTPISSVIWALVLLPFVFPVLKKRFSRRGKKG